MSSAGTRERDLFQVRDSGKTITSEAWLNAKGVLLPGRVNANVGKQITVSESHKRSRDGSYRAGGPFYTSLVRDFINAPSASSVYNSALGKFYSGPVYGKMPTEAEMKELSYENISRSFGASNEASMLEDGTTAIHLCSPTNPASKLGVTLAETFREGVPSLPGIQQWRAKTKILKGLGSEYLNYQFGWAPLAHEVHEVSAAARQHRDLLQQYQRGEGSDTHRSFSFPSSHSYASLPLTEPSSWSGLPTGWDVKGNGTRQVSRVRETKRWFEGVFTYGLPSSTDSWRRAMGFGSDADVLFGLALDPEILWELTPWSWAVDWFTNAGDVISNVTSFGLAGLVMRYGYMMEESIERITVQGRCPDLICGTYATNKSGKEPHWVLSTKTLGNYSCGTECVTKRRIPASPFGFGVSWQGLSPTQLAITAALGITRSL